VPSSTELPAFPSSGTTEPLVLSRGNTFCVVNRAGDIAPEGARDLGLFHEDTRHLSRFELSIDSGGGTATVLSSETNGTSSQIDLTLSGGGSGGFFADPQNFLHLRRRQILDDDQLIERLSATNHLRRPVTVEISFAMAADFADIFEVRGARREVRGKLLPTERGRDSIRFSYRGTDGELYSTCVRMIPEQSEIAGDRVRFRLALQPGETTVLEITILAHRGEACAAPEWRPFDLRMRAAAKHHQEFLDGATRVRCDNNRFEALLARALLDLDGLRLVAGGHRMLGAGIPWFAAPFGRDAILASLFCLPVVPDLAVETLRALAALQGSRDDPWREEEPGRILHELRRGEMTRAGEVPHSPYYGTIDATPLWLILLRETWRWTADNALLDELAPNAERALAWIDRRLAVDGGLLRYHPTHTRGLENQGWKDSRDGVSFPDGRIARPPIALIEAQGYVVAAFDAMSSLRRRQRDAHGTARLRERAHDLRRRIERDFWCEETGFHALALDGEGHKVATVTSNPGHLAFCRAAPPERIARIAEVLLSDEMYTGWGVRTLARGQAVYNPLSYHNGTVWPHDNALCAYGLAQAGHVDAALKICEGLYAASLHYRDLRLPELFCGTARGEGDSLVHYPVSCSPQAWASAAFFLLLQAVLGIRPDAEHKRLAIRNPRLPSFLRRLDLDSMRVGRARVSLHFERHDGRTHVDLVGVEGDSGLKVVIEVG
jgi:glycogen debranching enzyme